MTIDNESYPDGINFLLFGIALIPALLGLVGIGILYGTLQLGEEDKAWAHLG